MRQDDGLASDCCPNSTKLTGRRFFPVIKYTIQLQGYEG